MPCIPGFEFEASSFHSALPSWSTKTLGVVQDRQALETPSWLSAISGHFTAHPIESNSPALPAPDIFMQHGGKKTGPERIQRQPETGIESRINIHIGCFRIPMGLAHLLRVETRDPNIILHSRKLLSGNQL